MKTQLIDRNGLLKPIGMFFILLGMFLLILLLYVCCCQENLFAQSGTFIDDHYTYSFSEPEATIVYVRYKKPERIIRTIEPSADINQLSSQLMMHNTVSFGSPIVYAKGVDIPEDHKTDGKGKKGIMKIKMKSAIKNEDVVVKQD